MTETKPSPVACAAVRDSSGKVWLGKRHSDCLFLMNRFGVPYVDRVEGFVNQLGTFLTRKEAARAAVLSGQITRSLSIEPNIDLFSEDLY